MRISENQIQRIVHLVFKELKGGNHVQFKAKEEKVLQRAIEIVKRDFDKERELDREVNEIMDNLERENPGGFQRYKMFPLLKKKLAEKKGIIL